VNQPSRDELRRVFIDGRNKWGHGCLNEPFRILSGLANEEDLAALSHSPPDEGSPLTSALQLTLSHLEGCVPIVVERPKYDLNVVQHWYPQLAPAMQSLKGILECPAERCMLSERTTWLLEELAAGERILYNTRCSGE
jgi:hypothetical protein